MASTDKKLTGTYTNPVITGDWSDPGVVRVGEDYYSVRSSFGWQPALHVAHSRDLINWKYIGFADYHNACDIVHGETDDGVWGSDIGYNPNDEHFLIYAPVHAEIHVFRSKDPSGPYQHKGKVINGYDPGFFADDDGQLYLTKAGGDIHRLSPDGLRAEPNPIASLGEGEGPEIFKKDDYYYFITSPGGTRPYQDHMIISYRSTTIEGPWEPDPKNPMMHAPHTTGADLQGPGHGEVFQTQKGEWFITYHAYELSHYSLGRQMGMEPIEWTEDGWWRPKNGRIPSRSNPLPDLEPTDATLQSSDDFSSKELGKQWFFHSQPDMSGQLWSLEQRKNWLRIHAQEGDISSLAVSPARFLQRVTLKAFEIETLVDFKANEIGDAAGLHFYHDPDRSFWLTTTFHEGQPVFEVGYYDRPFTGNKDPAELRPPQIRSIVRDKPAKKSIVAHHQNQLGEKVHLKIRVDGNESATFFISEDGNNWISLDATIYFGDSWHCSLLGKKPGAPDLGWVGCGRSNVWTGTTMGIYACRGESSNPSHADFSFFNVRDLSST